MVSTIITITKKQIIQGECPRQPQLNQNTYPSTPYEYYCGYDIKHMPLNEIDTTWKKLNNLLADNKVYTKSKIKKIYNNPCFFRYLGVNYKLILVTSPNQIFNTLEWGAKALDRLQYYGDDTHLVKIKLKGKEYYAVGRVVYQKSYQVEFNKMMVQHAIQDLKDHVKSLNEKINGGGQ